MGLILTCLRGVARETNFRLASCFMAMVIPGCLLGHGDILWKFYRNVICNVKKAAAFRYEMSGGRFFFEKTMGIFGSLTNET